MKSEGKDQQTRQRDKVRLNQPTDYESQEEAETEIKRLKFMLASSPTTTYACEPFGDFTCTFISENITKLLGYLPSDFLDNPGFWANLIHPDDKDFVFNELGSPLENDFYALEYRFKHKDGSYRWMRDELRLIRDADTKPLEIVGSWTDITERMQAEEAIAENKKFLDTIFEAAPT